MLHIVKYVDSTWCAFSSYLMHFVRCPVPFFCWRSTYIMLRLENCHYVYQKYLFRMEFRAGGEEICLFLWPHPKHLKKILLFK